MSVSRAAVRETAAVERPGEHDVTVIGAGSVGSTLARALLAAGLAPCVWNRSLARAEPLAAAGIAVVDDAAAAIAASPIAVICLAEYPAAHQVLERLPDGTLDGRILVQLMSGSAADAERLAEAARARGARHLDALLYSYPRDLLSGEAILFFSGPRQDFEALEAAVLGRTEWNVTYVGEDIGRAKQISNVLEAASTNAIEGFFQSTALAAAIGIPIGEYMELLLPRLQPVIEDLMRVCATKIEAGDHRGEMRIDLWRTGIERQIADLESFGIDCRTLGIVSDQMDKRIAAGHPDDDMAGLYEVVKGPEPSG